MIVAVFEEQNERYTKIRDCLIAYALRHRISFDILRFRGGSACDAFEKYAGSISIAFVSLDIENNVGIGQKMAAINPYCIVSFYSRSRWELSSVLHTRLYDFYQWKTDEDIKGNFDAIMDLMLSICVQSKSVFSYSSRSEAYYLPFRSLTYFESDLKYVNIHFADSGAVPHGDADKAVRLYAKLSSIENALAEQGLRAQFVRIHQSYLVNMTHVTEVFKSSRMVCLTTGEKLPISEACYKSALEILTHYHAAVGIIPLGTANMEHVSQ